MADQEQLAILKQGADVWNKWRQENRGVEIDLREADLYRADLSYANLFGANLNGANLFRADLRCVNLRRANLRRTRLRRADLSDAKLSYVNLGSADLFRANLDSADLNGSNLFRADFRRASLIDANLSTVNLYGANLSGADLIAADLSAANLGAANLFRADLSDVRLTHADLSGASLVETNLTRSVLTDCKIYGISAWGLKLEGAEQSNLVITSSSEPTITVDDLEVALFIYLLLNNKKIRNVLDTVGKKGVLILGRFSPERKQVLDALRDKLRKLNFVPMMFDFEGATTKDFTETVKILAGMSRFIIADITSPKSSPLELQATVQDYKVPFVPIIQDGEEPFSMFANLQNYPWMLKLLKYKDSDQLIAVIDKAIIKPAQIKADALNIQKAEDVQTRHASDYL